MLRYRFRSALIAAADSVAPLPAARMRLARRYTAYCRKVLGNPDLDVVVKVHDKKNIDRHLVAIRRNRSRIELTCHRAMILRHFHVLQSRLYPCVALVALARIETLRVVVEISDGEVSGPGLISFCSRDPRAILIPDDGFFSSGGYQDDRENARANTVAWNTRSDCIAWRGSTTGHGRISKDHLAADDPELLPRVRLCMRLRAVPGTDVKISRVVQSDDEALHRERLTKAGIFGQNISSLAWNGFKFAIDIDGNSNAWSNLFTRMIMGCCVLKVASPSGYRQWYYEEIQPWTHYVPVKADLTDIEARIAWCRTNSDKCGNIAGRAQAFAMAHDLKTEFIRAVGRVCAAHRAGTLRTEL